MRRFLTVWPTLMTALGCAVFTLISIAAAAAADTGKIPPRYMCSCELEYKNCSFCQADYEYNGYNEADETADGDYYYQQKYESLYSRPVDFGETQCPRREEKEEVKENGDVYLYALPENMYGSLAMPSMDAIGREGLEGIMEPSWSDLQFWFDEQYTGSPYVAENQPEFEAKSSLALFTWDPADLLTLEDRETLRGLALAAGRSSGASRAVLSDYIESLGVEAVDLSNRFEKASGLVVPAMADDLAETAVFIACVRLIERGELESEEALALLIKSLSMRSTQWNRWIDRVTENGDECDAEEKLSGARPEETKDDAAPRNIKLAANPVLKAAILTAAASLERLGDTISGISRQIRDLY